MKDKRKTILVAALIITGMLITYPVRSLVGGYYFQQALFTLREPGPDKEKGLPVSVRTMPAYLSAIRSLELACVTAPSRSRYDAALSEVYTRMGTWTAAMELMHAPLPDGSMNSKDAYLRAENYLKAAIKSEPTNPDYHFALGNLYDTADRDGGQAEKELSRALAAYPVNVPLRYAVANEHLRAGRKGDALEQAGLLARIIGKNTPGTNHGNYLFGAFDIAWQASGDPEVVKGICPDEAGARQTVKKFLELKGIKE